MTTPMPRSTPRLQLVPTSVDLYDSTVRQAPLLAVDIVGFGTHYPHDSSQVQVRKRLYQHLTESFGVTGLPWWECHREDRGDGILLIAPSQTDPALFLSPFAHHLKSILRRANATHHPPLRLRLALHYGRIHHDAHGVTGSNLILLHRLLESPAFKRALRNTSTELGLIVSDPLYRQILTHNNRINPSDYRRIHITHKETRRTPAWIWGTNTE